MRIFDAIFPTPYSLLPTPYSLLPTPFGKVNNFLTSEVINCNFQFSILICLCLHPVH
ncbi:MULTISPECIES: hypothetical protein [Moorena]|uniref:hypothetical protein n=1 Tax=Moorena TaxID=1155738 RepID=UPI000300B912|nr:MULTISPECIES: hypothetical protein [Moorena]NEP32219.1 hypothetical protein [Moorena sp. SIO3B2]NEP68924.1 hypothetical protein [Moorena sp. SIO3A5]NEQ06995.1 hypothetical protein [Moorena sp. SIO4E2]NER88539.1 hypothetical protein [Moorena sp. SIO3A2]NES43251.1 hypothetical protein [Moorena sp. SIO2C4]